MKTNTPAEKTNPLFIIESKDTKGNPEKKVSAPLLHQHIRDTRHYFFVQDGAKSALHIYWYSHGVYSLVNADMVKGHIKACISEVDPLLVNMRVIDEVYRNLVTDLDKFKKSEDVDANERIINFQNGIYQLDKKRLLQHSPKYLSTIQLPCQYKEHGVAPVFDKYIQHLTAGDKDTAGLLLQFMGAVLSNIRGYRMKKALIMVGDGDTGKSQLKELVSMLIGRSNTTGIDLAELEGRFGTSSLYGKRLAGSNDMGYTPISELKTFKKVTGGDTLHAEFKGENPFQFVFGGLLWFCANKEPRFGGDKGDWVYDRIIIVPCNNPVLYKDKFLLDKLYKEREAIVCRAVQALDSLINNNYEFSIPEQSKQAIKAYKKDNSTVLAFMEECTEKRNRNENSTPKRVYDAYTAWCKDNSHGRPETKQDFQMELRRLGKDTTKRGTNGSSRIYADWQLTEDCKAEYLTITYYG